MRAAGVALALLLSAGCAHRPPQVRPLSTTAGHPLQVLETVPASRPVRAIELFPQQFEGASYSVVDESGRVTGALAMQRAAADRFNAMFSISEDGARTLFMREDNAGNIVMTASIEAAENALTIFDPPLVMAWRELAPGGSRTSESSMRVLDSRRPSKVRETGTASRIVSFVGDERIRTPTGEFLAHRLEVRFSAKLRLADAQEHAILHVVPGLGVVAEQSAQTITMVGALQRTKRRTIVMNKQSGRSD